MDAGPQPRRRPSVHAPQPTLTQRLKTKFEDISWFPLSLYSTVSSYSMQLGSWAEMLVWISLNRAHLLLGTPMDKAEQRSMHWTKSSIKLAIDLALISYFFIRHKEFVRPLNKILKKFLEPQNGAAATTPNPTLSDSEKKDITTIKNKLSNAKNPSRLKQIGQYALMLPLPMLMLFGFTIFSQLVIRDSDYRCESFSFGTLLKEIFAPNSVLEGLVNYLYLAATAGFSIALVKSTEDPVVSKASSLLEEINAKTNKTTQAALTLEQQKSAARSCQKSYIKTTLAQSLSYVFHLINCYLMISFILSARVNATYTRGQSDQLQTNSSYFGGLLACGSFTLLLSLARAYYLYKKQFLPKLRQRFPLANPARQPLIPDNNKASHATKTIDTATTAVITLPALATCLLMAYMHLTMTAALMGNGALCAKQGLFSHLLGEFSASFSSLIFLGTLVFAAYNYTPSLKTDTTIIRDLQKQIGNQQQPTPTTTAAAP